MATHDNSLGTMSDTFQVGKGGPNIKNNSGVIESRNDDDDAYVQMDVNQLITMSGGTASVPCVRLNGAAATGMYAPAANQIGYSISGNQNFRVEDGACIFGKPGAGSVPPVPTNMKAASWTSDSTSSNVAGVKWDFHAPGGTGNALPGYFSWKQSTPVGSGTTPHSSYTDSMVLDPTGSLSLQRSEDVQFYIGVAATKPTTLDGPAVVMPEVTAEPTAITATLGAIYWFDNELKCIQPDGTIGVLDFTAD